MLRPPSLGQSHEDVARPLWFVINLDILNDLYDPIQGNDYDLVRDSEVKSKVNRLTITNDGKERWRAY